MNKFYVTTPIYYINDKPHIGHTYTTIAADVLARYYRAKLGQGNVFFLTGTDENSKKTLVAAEEAGQDVQTYTDSTAAHWQDVWRKLEIDYDRFIRTTESDHINAVRDVITRIYDAGDIEPGEYEGHYCFKCEAFYKDDELDNGKCRIHKTDCELIKEKNYFFKLSRYEDKLKKYIQNNPDFIQPEARRNEVLAFIERGLEDISISREGQKWGIKLPFDQSQVVYVWFDALINYLTGVGYPGGANYKKFWPADTHIIGKDIIKFHCVIWPAMLLSAGIDLPKKVFAHGFFTIDGEKISKSLGNAIDPIELSEKYGNDALRYFLLREIPFGSDGDFSHERFEAVYNADLANDLGNLVQRVASMLDKYCGGKFDINKEIQAKEYSQYDKLVDHCISNLEFYRSLQVIFSKVDQLNIYIEKNKPWEKNQNDIGEFAELESTLECCVEGILWVAKRLEPFLPETTKKIQKTFTGGKVDSGVGILFPRIEHES